MQRRKLLNRVAQRAFRARKDASIRELSVRAVELRDELALMGESNKDLHGRIFLQEQKVEGLELENTELKQRLLGMTGEVDNSQMEIEHSPPNAASSEGDIVSAMANGCL